MRSGRVEVGAVQQGPRCSGGERLNGSALHLRESTQPPCSRWEDDVAIPSQEGLSGQDVGMAELPAALESLLAARAGARGHRGVQAATDLWTRRESAPILT